MVFFPCHHVYSILNLHRHSDLLPGYLGLRVLDCTMSELGDLGRFIVGKDADTPQAVRFRRRSAVQYDVCVDAASGVLFDSFVYPRCPVVVGSSMKLGKGTLAPTVERGMSREMLLARSPSALIRIDILWKSSKPCISYCRFVGG